MTGSAALLILMFIAVDGLIAAAIIYTAVSTYWSPLAEAFPPREPAPGALLREFQSCGAEILNLTWCIHIAADDDCLHLRPALLARLIGIRSASIPWDQIKPEPPKRPGRRPRRAAIAGHTLELPRWCLELAAPPDTPAPS